MRIKNNAEEMECCENPNVINNQGSIVCTNCATVLGDNLIIGEELRAYTQDEINSRKRTEKRWREVGSRTCIGQERADSKGNRLDAGTKTLYYRLDKINGSLISSLERNKWVAKPKLNQLASKLGIPGYVKETAWRIYGECAKKKLTMGRSIYGFIAASLYASIRIHELPRLLEEVCDSELVPQRTVHKSLGLLIKEILPELGLKYKPITSKLLVYRFGNDLDLPMNVQRTAVQLIEKAHANGLNSIGKDPRGLAASALYHATKILDNNAHSRTQAEIAEVAKITEVTLRSRVKDIKQFGK
jgi:transcription initiation factor TFIIB